MATFRPLLKKKKASIRSGAGADDVFQPIWFAFEIMESFLGSLYDVAETINTEDTTLHSEDMPAPPQAPIQPQQAVEIPLSSPSQSISSRPHTKPIKTNKKASLNTDEAQNKISESLDTLNHVLREKRNYVNDEDECDIYVKLLAKRLRKYPESMQQIVMYRWLAFRNSLSR
ncbi:unnamed protein product [Acanthoscelides obtectus]|uniref:Uncharacterized protein n=1 Tax=Acanthoscelides obtectus TaxID=200917 RepID=A0A9P0PBH4_ACAOB|nr:unnamed protein product [Acanthoscelides obtectus]CAK1647323.1 hypothetical protein AOBTE_LOCUS15180 [Acanthoscelides obtectus]